MPIDFGNLGNKIGQFAKEAKEAAGHRVTTPPTQPAAAPQTYVPAEEESVAYGSAHLRHRAGMLLVDSIASNSTSIVMGSDDLNGSTGFVWDLKKLPGHAMTFGPTRKGGKGVSSIIPGLLTYTAGSRLVVDPKAENFWVTSERARAAGHRVVLMDPWNEANRRYGSKVGVSEKVTRFNPLSFLDPTAGDFADDVAAIADANIVVPDSVNKHFDESARELVAGCIAAVVEENPGKASLRDVREMITLGDEELAQMVMRIVAGNPKSLAGRKLRRFAKSTSEISSVRSTAETQTAFLDSETLLDAMETDDPPFDLAELATGRVSLFLVLPVDRLETHGRWLRMIITLAIRAIARQETPPENPVLFVLDEMGTIGRLSMVETAFGLMAGLGIRLWGFLQDLVQLQGLYARTWETFISNSSVVQILKAHDATTSEYVSRFMGNGTINAKTGGWSRKQIRWDRPEEWEAMVREQQRPMLAQMTKDKHRDAENASLKIAVDSLHASGFNKYARTEWTPDEQLIARPLLDPDEVRRLADERCLLLIPGSTPVAQFRTIYYKHPLFNGLYRPNPYFRAGTSAT